MIPHIKKSMDERFTYLVEKYLDHDLSESERGEFGKFLEDPECRKYLEDAVKIEKIMKKGMNQLISNGDILKVLDPDEADLIDEIKEDVLKYGLIDDPVTRAEVKRMHEQMIRHHRIRILLRYVLPAASLLVGVYFLWVNYLVPIPQSLFRAQYKPYEFAVILPTTITDERIRAAMSMYKTGNYAGSAGLCNEIIASGTYEADIHFLYGLNLMGLDSMLRAIKEFDAQLSLTSAKEAVRQLPVHGYKGLCYLRLNKPVSAVVEMLKQYYGDFRIKPGKGK